MGKKAKTTNVSNGNVEYNNGLKCIISARNDEQKDMLRTISKNIITFVKGSPGSGKTLLAVTYALQQLFKHKFKKIVFTRPAVEAAGEKMGFLPGDMSDKIYPYMIPIFETLLELLPAEVVKKMTNKNGGDPVIRIIPLAFMRGITFKNSIIVCDEMQNSTGKQVRMVLTRIGEGSQMVLCGDVKQTDIEVMGNRVNGLLDAFNILQGIKDIGFVTLTQESIFRHPIIKGIEQRYESRG